MEKFDFSKIEDRNLPEGVKGVLLMRHKEKGE